MNTLTPMQSACWFGRDTHSGFLGGVAAHLYTEFNAQALDLHKLEAALQRLYREHPMLRLALHKDGQAVIREASNTPPPLLEIDDLRTLCEQEQKASLLQKRDQWTHQRLALGDGQVARFSVSLCSEDRIRLHIDTDMIAIDPSSFRLLMEDLALFYHTDDAPYASAPSFFEWHYAVQNHADYRKLYTRDRQWWQAHLEDIAPAPSLPFTKEMLNGAQSHCLHDQLSLDDVAALEKLARHNHITLSSLVIGTFAFSLSQFTQDKDFRLNIPTFWRAPVLPEADRSIGDFADFVLLSVHTEKHRHLADFIQAVGLQMIPLLEHSHYSGVNILRDLSRHHGETQLAPVVFTAALDLSGGQLFSDSVRQAFGSMDWCISQGPQVALDAQAVRTDSGILLNWDIRLDALELHWVNQVFRLFANTLRTICRTPALLSSDFNNLLDAVNQQDSLPPCSSTSPNDREAPLSALQQAYLLGRTPMLPLGGVAMQEFREYSGDFPIQTLRDRLRSLVERHTSLRTYINADKLSQTVSEKIVVNLIETDLTQMSIDAANAYMDRYRETYTHALFDLGLPPWNITVFQLHDNQLAVFARFDALIVDGRAIATLMNELFTLDEVEPTAALLEQDEPTSDANRESAKEYWHEKLANIKEAPQIPWLAPLDTIHEVRFKRLSTTLDAKTFRQFCKLSAKRGLFKNTAVMSVILDLLAQWSKDHFIYAALPVLPLYSGALANHSTFIAVTWQYDSNDVIEQAKQLQHDIHEGLQNLSFSGVDIARQLVEQCDAKPILPVVITNGLSWPVAPADQTMQLKNGLTQTPQVAMDIRFSKHEKGGLILSIDYVTNAVDTAAVTSLLEAINSTMHEVVETGEFHVDRLLVADKSSVSESLLLTTDQGNQAIEDRILKVYSEAIGITDKNQLSKDTNFISVGLRPQHLKSILKYLNSEFSMELSGKDIIKCRNATEIKALIQGPR